MSIHTTVFPVDLRVADDPGDLTWPISIRSGDLSGAEPFAMHLTVDQARDLYAELSAALQSLEAEPSQRDPIPLHLRSEKRISGQSDRRQMVRDMVEHHHGQRSTDTCGPTCICQQDADRVATKS